MRAPLVVLNGQPCMLPDRFRRLHFLHQLEDSFGVAGLDSPLQPVRAENVFRGCRRLLPPQAAAFLAKVEHSGLAAIMHAECRINLDRPTEFA